MSESWTVQGGLPSCWGWGNVGVEETARSVGGEKTEESVGGEKTERSVVEWLHYK